MRRCGTVVAAAIVVAGCGDGAEPPADGAAVITTTTDAPATTPEPAPETTVEAVDEPVDDEPTAPAATDVATTEPPPTTAAPTSQGNDEIREVEAWSLVANLGTNVHDIVQVESGFVAIGSLERRSPGVWTSADGVTWAEAAFEPGEVEFLDGVVVGTRGVVAVGGNRVWESPDGLTWAAPTEIGPAPTDDDSGTGIGGVVELEGVLYAGGAQSDVATVWRSDAVGSWSIAATDLGEPGWEHEVRELAVGPSGIVAVGHGEPEPGPLQERRPLIWHSGDGTSWTPVELTGDFEGRGGLLKTVVWSDALGAYFAAGWDGVSAQNQRAIVFTSPDGVTWQQVVDAGLDSAVVDEKLHGITVTEFGLMAGGSDEYSDNPNAFGILWVSADGQSWQPGSLVADEAWVNAVTPIGDGRCLAAGNSFSSGGLVWQGPCDSLFNG